MRKIISAVAGSLVFGMASCPAQAEGPAPLRVISEGPGALYRADPTVQFVVHSQRAGRDFLVQVTPAGHKPWLPGQKAPVVYVLDGGFGIMAPSAHFLGASNAMLPAYIVTVSYPAGQRGSRERDLLFANATRLEGTTAIGGGAEAFMAFLIDELRPFIEGKYPVDPGNSVLVGHSLSGIFTANVLARRPEAFAGYLIGSPSVWAEPGIVDRLARLPALATPRRVYVAYGEDEAPHMVDGGGRVARAVARNRAAFTSRVHVFEGADHLSFYPELTVRGLGYLLPRKRPISYPIPTPVAPDVLRRYEGTYVLSDGRKMDVAVKDGRLMTAMAYPVELSAFPAPGRFFVNGVDAQFAFEGPKDGPPDVLRIDYNGDLAVARRAP
jgi:predicted alpha/beta superfamily hydrolase